MLDGVQLNSLERFIISPYFNPREDAIKLITYYKSEIKKTRPKLSKEEVFIHLFQAEHFDDQKLRLLLSKVLVLVKRFLFFEYAEDNESNVQNLLAQAYFKIGHEDLFVKTINKSKKKLEKQVWRNTEYFRLQLDLEQQYYDYISEHARSKENNLQVLTDTLDVYYFANKLKQACLILGHQAVYKKEYDTSSLEHALTYIESRPALIESTPAIGIYYYCYLAMSSEDSEEMFLKFRKLLEKSKEKFKEEEVRVIYILAINYCIKRLNSGEAKYVKESFQLYRAGIESGYLLTNNTLSQFTYKNAVALGLGLKEYEWVEAFIFKFKDKLESKYKESIFTFNLAKLKQAQKKYEEAMSLLIQFNPDDLLLTLAAKTNLLKMYYELDELDSLESLLQSMSAFLNRKKVLGYHKKHYKNIIKFTKKMINLPPYSKKERVQLKIEIEEAEMRSEKEWFLEQLGD